jgi:HlyD family secretion protein
METRKSMVGLGMLWIGKHRWQTAIFLILIAGGGYYYFVYKPDQASKATPTFQTGTVKKTDIRSAVTGSGQVYAREQVDLKPVVAGDAIEVLRVAVKDDQEVKKGDLIAVLDTKDAEKAVRDALLSVQIAEIKMRQTVKEADTKSEGDKLTRQTQEVALAQARNRLADAREERADYSVRAPFDGIVTGLSVAAGDSISRSDVLASVITKELHAQVLLNEIDAVNVKTGNVAALSFDALGGKKISGTVTKMDTIGTVSQNVVSYTVEIGFDTAESALKPGMSTDVEILIEEKLGVLAVLSSAVKSDDRGKYVLVPKTGTESTQGSGVGGFKDLPYRPARVETGIADEAMTEILSGLSEGDAIVTQMSQATSGTSRTGTGQKSGSASLIPAGTGSGSGMRLH